MQLLLLIVLLGGAACSQPGFDNDIDEAFREARAFTRGNQLTVTTGAVTRTWALTPQGLLTTDITAPGVDPAITAVQPLFRSDWHLPGIVPDTAGAHLVSLTANPANDEGFTTDYLEVVAEFEYPSVQVGLKYVVWAYPKAPGLRTQVFVKDLGGITAKDSSGTPRVEYLPIATSTLEKRAIGYYNDTQHRNTRETEILREEIVTVPSETTAVNDWASLVSLEAARSGVIVVQESHKCVNQPGVHTGAFYMDSAGIRASGTGLRPSDMTTDYQPLWAYWTILYQGQDDERELALKTFDRYRYPVDPERDLYIMANNWGSSSSGDSSRYASREANILVEIQSQQDLGIDVQQIDSGWQGKQWDTWRTAATASTSLGDYEVYPDGWTNIRAASSETGVTLGLWAAWTIPGDDLWLHYQDGGFKYYKLDFAQLRTYRIFQDFINKIRTFVLRADHEVRVNWDVTENPPRIGYYFSREYGNIYLENRKPLKPANAVYTPYLVLRDAWQVSKYVNLNKFQITVQNIERVSRVLSDAYRYNHPYTVAITLMGSPIFFQETRFYTEAARARIRPLLRAYKTHRAAMADGYVFPIGATPDNQSWTGFQNHNPETHTGYLTIFREIDNTETTRSIRLKFVKGRMLVLTDLLTGREQDIYADDGGGVSLSIPEPADFRFFRYRLKE